MGMEADTGLILSKMVDRIVQHDKDLEQIPSLWNNVIENQKDLQQMKRTLPKLVDILNRFQNLEQWRISSNYWALKSFDDSGMVFTRVTNGVKEEVNIPSSIFKNIKEDDFRDFNIKSKESKLREYVYTDKDSEVEIPESLVKFIKGFNLKELGFDSTFKKESSGVDKERVLELLKLNKKTGEIAEILGCSESYISQLKKKLLPKDLKSKT